MNENAPNSILPCVAVTVNMECTNAEAINAYHSSFVFVSVLGFKFLSEPIGQFGPAISGFDVLK